MSESREEQEYLDAIVAEHAPIRCKREHADAYRYELLCWAVDKWNDEVLYRPVQNVHRRALDDTWRTLIKKLGGDPEVLLKLPKHDIMVQQHPEAFREARDSTHARKGVREDGWPITQGRRND